MFWLLGVILLIFGIIFILLGILGFREEELEEEEEREEVKKEVKAGGVVLIGPIPIVFGESKYAVIALILTIVLMVISLILMLGLRT